MSELSYLEKLLDGVEVEWVPVSELFQIKNGYTPSKSKKEFWENGTIPWFRLEDVRVNGRELNDSIQHINPLGVKGFLFPKNSIFMSTTATIGEYALVRVPYLTNQQITNFSISEKFSEAVNIKYIFYRFYDFGKWCTENANKSGGVSIIGLKKLSQYQFPIPCPDNPEKSLAIQSEIVRILDKFTALTAELTAELTMRKKQYNYYRDQLLSFEQGEVEWKTLGEITTKIASGRNKTRDADGKFPVYGSTGLIGFIDKAAYSGDLLLVARVGAYAGLVNAVSGHFDVSDNTLIIHPSDSWNVRFAFHQLRHMNLNQYAVGAGQPLITGGLLKNLKVPFPSLKEQTRIAKILDKFETITASISEGLPREIELRQKQYEYYRDLLFSFPKPDAVSN
ncbi:TPA: restriction endonuclease subunit S [Escherichia coli]|nr:restriction endonuclease subunit S [Escherichia coli]EIX8979807.1 restriction endonuclease subunit S [Escherichia coli]HAW5791669.1 restriction endonuclease subunit S [Escherichia coli]HBH4409416.1 restriction endonuclease subunit S [Escherichia coli]HCJ5539189.1 restriction endonuclease subunit S [Escherichia coli]